MCGLVGFSAKEGKTYNKDHINFLMLWNSFERGLDATGVYTPNNGLLKDSLNASQFINTKKFIDYKKDSIFIGHVRHATIGEKKVENAHPFHYGNIVLAHNGTLKNHYEMLRQAGGSVVDFNVDSQILAYLMDFYYNPTVLTKLEGAAAVIFTDLNEPDTLYCYRNSERPLFRGVNEDGMYISSIESSLKSIGCVNIKEFKENHLYKIKKAEIEKYIKLKTFKKTQTTTTASHIIRTDLLGKWCQFGTYGLNYINRGFSKDKYYYVVGIESSNTYEVHAINDNNKKEAISSYLFDKRTFDIQVGDIVRAYAQLYTNYGKTNQKEVCDKDDALYVYEIKTNNADLRKTEYKVLNLETNTKFCISGNMFYKIPNDSIVKTVEIHSGGNTAVTVSDESKIITEVEVVPEENIYTDIYLFVDELRDSYEQMVAKIEELSISADKKAKLLEPLEELKTKIEMGEDSIDYMINDYDYDEEEEEDTEEDSENTLFTGDLVWVKDMVDGVEVRQIATYLSENNGIADISVKNEATKERTIFKIDVSELVKLTAKEKEEFVCLAT